MRAAGRKDWFMDINRRGFLFLAAGGLLLLNGCGRKSARSALPRGSRVLALGDSLTAGFGASDGGDYPRRLADITGWQVINGGVSGDTSAQALARLPGLLQPKPGLALVCIGGNDFLRRIGEDETRANIGRILQTLQTASVPAVLVAEPHFTIGALVGSLSVPTKSTPTTKATACLPKKRPIFCAGRDSSDRSRYFPIYSGLK